MMNDGGLPLFAFETENPVVDHALISGFFAAMHSMTKEVFLDDIQNLEMGENRLIFGQRSTLDSGIIYGAIISDVRDHPDLLENILDRFLTEFALTYEDDIQIAVQFGASQKYEHFEENIQSEMKKRLRRIPFLRRRGIKTRGLGLILGITLFLIGIMTNLQLWGRLGTEMASLTMVLTLLMLPSGVAGWVAGEGRDGLLVASASGAIGVLGLTLSNIETLTQWVERVGIAGDVGAIIAVLTVLLVLVPAYGLVGYQCGTWVSRRCLYPAE